MNTYTIPALSPELWSQPLQESEHSVKVQDGSELFYRVWQGQEGCRRALILFHGGHEHSGRFQELVRGLDLRETAVFAWDARGHGRSPGVRGDARHFNELVQDAEAFVRHIEAEYGIAQQDMVVMGHSVGSVIVASWLHDYAPLVRGAVLGSPAFRVKLYAPFAVPALRLLQRVWPDAYVSSYVRPSMLTHDEEEAADRRADPLISPRIAVRVLTSLFAVARRVIQGAGSITTPVLLLSAGADWVVRRDAQQAFFNKLGAQEKTMEVYKDFYHEIYHERDRAMPIARAKGFIEHLFSRPAGAADERLLAGLNRKHYAELGRPLSWLEPKKYFYGLTRLALRSAGRLSDGIRLGWQAGFDSGRMLDYVYENRASGKGVVGRWFDRVFLDSPGWRGIRQRGENLERLLVQTIRGLRAQQRPVQVVDVAAGAGRYVINVLQTLDDPGVSALCLDLDEKGLDEGQHAAVGRGVQNVRFARGDAFDKTALARLPRCNVAIVSGLYELFADNHKILDSLRGIHAALADDGYLIYTNQPHHPQLELIARTLINRDGEPWVMRPRPQTEMNALVRAAGFEPREMALDDDGIFTVTVARKRG